MNVLFDNSSVHQLMVSVMVIDDQLTSRIILEKVINSIGNHIRVITFENAKSALQAAEEDPPDLILVDYMMPELDGVEFIKRLRRIPACRDIPVVVITISDEKKVMYHALESGATDFLTKPIDHYECKVRCRNLLTMRRQQMIIRSRAKSLEMQVNDAVSQILIREKETLSRLARAGEFKEADARPHQIRIGSISRVIARELGMDREFCENINIAAPLHDIGKIGIPDRILLKQDALDQEEREIMQTHTIIGHEILKDSPSNYLQMGAIIALNHHERFDGSGYPAGKSGEDIPITSRIVATADVFDALLSERPYKQAWPMHATLKEINRQKHRQLDPGCVNALLKRLDEIINCRQQVAAS